MKNAVLLYDDDDSDCEVITELLTDKGLAVFGTANLEEAADKIFSEYPPAVFIADFDKYAWDKTGPAFETIRRKYNLEAGSFGPHGALSLIVEAQKKVPDTRIILISGINPKSSAEKIGVFAYVGKPISDLSGDNSLSCLTEACRLGPLRPEEIDRTGKLRVGPYDLRSEQFRSYLEQFHHARSLERE